MKWILTVVVLCFSMPAFAIKVGDILPKLEVQDESGKTLQPWTGKQTLINFWATWCDACKVELKEMESAVSKLGPGRQVVFVSLDKEPKKAKEYFTKEFKQGSPMLTGLFYDSGFAMADALGVESFPMTLVVDDKGKVLKIQNGFKPGTGSTEALFEELNKSRQ
jgi:thiol-disulfide isomerase/thioredoxin